MLILRWRAGDERAREELVQMLMPMARALARRYARSRDDLDDLEQVASIGLLKAIERFEPDREILLSTYASSIVVGELKRWFRDSAWAVKVPRGAKELAVRIEAALPALTARLGRSPTIAEIAIAIGTDHESVLEALEARTASVVASLDGFAEDDSSSTSGGPASEDAGFEAAEHRAVLGPALQALSERERFVLELRFSDGLSQAEIGERIGVSQMQVSRILRTALDRAAQAAA